ncbi:MAG: hypothetical protein RR242_03120 [Clostridium sp.]
MTGHSNLPWNNDEIADHLKSAMDTLTPDVFDKIDLQTPQEPYRERSKVIKLYHHMRIAGMVAAACLCVVLLGNGVAAFQNSRVESFIGIDVNPSIELSVNRNNKVLKAEALNEDATEILDDMKLKNVDLNIAVNAVIGSMVRHGYLDEVENAILVTVSNDDQEKAASLRKDVVGDIESSLEEHKLEAVVYDQQADVTDEVKRISKEYDLSYGKAYFLQELVAENNLSDEDLKLFAGMTMEEISREIAERSYNIRKDKDTKTDEHSVVSEESLGKVTTAADSSSASAKTEPSTEPVKETTSGTTSDSTSGSTSGTTSGTTTPAASVQSTTSATTGASESQDGENTGNNKKVKIDYVDYDDGKMNVVFKDKVKWKNTTVSVKDENGESYSAKFTDTASDSCEIEVVGLPGGVNCTFTLGGVASKDGGAYSTVKGYFDTPDIADDANETEEKKTTTPTEAVSVPETPTVSGTVPPTSATVSE